MNRYVTLNEINKVIGIRLAITIVDGEIQSDIGELGQIMQPDGSFMDDPTVYPAATDPLQAIQDDLLNITNLSLTLLGEIDILKGGV